MKKILIILLAISVTSCNWFKQKTKDTVNKSGEVVAKAGSEFADGVSKGIKQTFQNEIIISDGLQKEGLKAGQVTIASTDSTTDNIISAYLIFESNINRKITVKVFNESGLEYGRASQIITGQKDEAKFIDFTMDKRTHVSTKGKIVFE